jgi:hypothetical protein
MERPAELAQCSLYAVAILKRSSGGSCTRIWQRCATANSTTITTTTTTIIIIIIIIMGTPAEIQVEHLQNTSLYHYPFTSPSLTSVSPMAGSLPVDGSANKNLPCQSRHPHTILTRRGGLNGGLWARELQPTEL